MSIPLNILICEDREEDAKNLCQFLDSCSIPNQYSLCKNGEELIKMYQPQTYDLLLTDIYMDRMSGVEAVKKIRKIDKKIPIAFITTSMDFALEGYRLSVSKYIEKPFKAEDIEEILQIAKVKKKNAPSLCFHKNGKEEKIFLSQVLYFEQQAHKLNVYLSDGEIKTYYEKISEILPKLESYSFFHCHKSYLVNLAFIRSINSEYRCFIMQNQANIPIRRESLSTAKKTLSKYLIDQSKSKIL